MFATKIITKVMVKIGNENETIFLNIIYGTKGGYLQFFPHDMQKKRW
jgi:hypothetical protein